MHLLCKGLFESVPTETMFGSVVKFYISCAMANTDRKLKLKSGLCGGMILWELRLKKGVPVWLPCVCASRLTFFLKNAKYTCIFWGKFNGMVDREGHGLNPSPGASFHGGRKKAFHKMGCPAIVQFSQEIPPSKGHIALNLAQHSLISGLLLSCEHTVHCMTFS